MRLQRLDGTVKCQLGTLAGLVLALASIFCCAPPSQAQSPELAGMAHVAFRVTDLDKSRNFYSRLGFEEAFQLADPGKPVVSYIKVNDRQFIELYERGAESQPLGLMHVCFEANDIGSAHDFYVSKGLQPTEPKKARAGNLLMLLHDPEGQLLEYTQYLPGSLHSEDRGKHLGEKRIAQHLASATTAVQDSAVERAFYTAKLGFEAESPASARLRIAGGSGDELELVAASPASNARITFAVTDVTKASAALRSRGFAVRKDRGSVSVMDPDGTAVVFVLKR